VTPATTILGSAPAAPPPAAPHARGAVKAEHAFGGSLLDLPSKVTAAASPKAVAAAIASVARSYADDHPAQFALAILITLLCVLLLVRELRRDLRVR
jgi:hypothetical protein